MPLTDGTNMNLASAASGNMSTAVDDVKIALVDTDAADQDETIWINDKWSTYLGIYKAVPEVKTAIDMRAIWTLGKGFTADARASVILNNITGWGRDTFNGILKNMIVARRIGGDSFAEIIRDEDTGILINLKPLDPGSMRIVVDKKGIIKRYEQVLKTRKKESDAIKFKPEEIFHLVNKRVADEIHGVSDIEALQNIVLANNESFDDMRKLMHRHVKPIMGFKLDTDNTTKINAFAAKMDAVVNKGENIYIPKDTVEFELISVPANATLNPLPWREHLKNYFFQVVGIPQIILGSSGEFTESTAKIAYLAFQQSVEDEQLDIEEQVWNQLFFKIELTFPASLQNEMLSDTAKDGQTQQTGFQQSDTTMGMGE